MFTMENIVTAYAIVVTSIILWNFFKTQSSVKSRLEYLEQDFRMTTDGVYRTIEETKDGLEDSIAELKRDLDAEVNTLYRSMERFEEETYSSKK
jgi:hypothetical protein